MSRSNTERAPKSAIEYEVYVPSTSNEGSPFDPHIIASFKERWTDLFGGLTDTRQKNEGVWKIGTYEMRDEIVIWRALDEKDECRSEVAQLKQEMESELRQERILIIRRSIEFV